MYPGFVFGFTDNITRSKTMVCCAGDLLINPTSLIALTLPAKLLLSHYPPFVFVRGQMLIIREPDQMSVPLLVANAIIPFWTALGLRIEQKCDSQSDSVAFRFYKHF